MSSYQDIDVRLHVIEDKVEFLMKVSQVTLQVNSPFATAPQIVKMTMGEFYTEMKRQGGMIVGDSQASVDEVVGSGEIEPGVKGNDLPIEFLEGELADSTPSVSETSNLLSFPVSDKGSDENRPAVVSADDPCV